MCFSYAFRLRPAQAWDFYACAKKVSASKPRLSAMCFWSTPGVFFWQRSPRTVLEWLQQHTPPPARAKLPIQLIRARHESFFIRGGRPDAPPLPPETVEAVSAKFLHSKTTEAVTDSVTGFTPP